MQIRKTDGHTLVVPADAARLVAGGKLDQRLFDITELNKAATRRAQQKGLKVIVGYKGAATATKADVRDAGTLRRTLKSLNADAVQTPQQGHRRTVGRRHQRRQDRRRASRTSGSTASARRASTSPCRRSARRRRGRPATTARASRSPSWTRASTPTHPDLKDQVIAAKNFTTAADAGDQRRPRHARRVHRGGHRRQVGRQVQGRRARREAPHRQGPGRQRLRRRLRHPRRHGVGRRAGRRRRQPQPGRRGHPRASTRWRPTVNKLSAEKGILFAIAAGNEGEPARRSARPGSADAALTVGAVDDNGRAGRLLQPRPARRRRRHQAGRDRARRGHHGRRRQGQPHRPGGRREARRAT